MKSNLIFLPNDSLKIKNIYKKAIAQGEEIYILSAYLTDWPYSKISICKNCKKFIFIIGTNFAITRKAACKTVLDWLPSKHKTSFYYNELTGYHPKILLVKVKNEYKLLVGSSNLSYGGLHTNYEINYYANINSAEYNKMLKWIYEIHINSNPINAHWIENYKERKIYHKQKPDLYKKSKEKFKSIIVAIGKKELDKIKFRKKQLRLFQNIQQKFKNYITKCADRKITDLNFYEKEFSLRQGSFFQDIQWVIKCKNSKWHIVCASLKNIFNAYEEFERNNKKDLHLIDFVVKTELDLLRDKNHPARKAWISEVLCQFYPEYYPLINNPIKKWLKQNKIDSPFGASEGSKYLDVTFKLRALLKENPRIKNFAELDAIAWKKKNTNY